MVADLEQRVCHELACALLVRAQPFAAREERGLDVLLAQVVDDSAVVAGDLARLLAQIEGQARSACDRPEASPGGRRRSRGTVSAGTGASCTSRRRRVEVVVALLDEALSGRGGERAGARSSVDAPLVRWSPAIEKHAAPRLRARRL